jgi:hypothetical protein
MSAFSPGIIDRTCNVVSSIWMTSVYQENLKVFFKSFIWSARITRDGVGPLHTDTRGVAAPPARQRRLRSLTAIRMTRTDTVSDTFMLTLTVVCLGGDLFLLALAASRGD